MAQVFRLRGVVDDGSPFEVPSSTAQPITFPRGVDVTIDVHLTTPAGDRVDLPVDVVAWFSVQEKLRPDQPYMVRPGVLVAGEPSMLRFELLDHHTVGLDPARYWYDVVLVLGGKTYQVVEASALRLKPSLVQESH